MRDFPFEQMSDTYSQLLFSSAESKYPLTKYGVVTREWDPDCCLIHRVENNWIFLAYGHWEWWKAGNMAIPKPYVRLQYQECRTKKETMSHNVTVLWRVFNAFMMARCHRLHSLGRYERPLRKYPYEKDVLNCTTALSAGPILLTVVTSPNSCCINNLTGPPQWPCQKNHVFSTSFYQYDE